jgi:2-oxoisovalerate dehydrogenase E1 component
MSTEVNMEISMEYKKGKHSKDTLIELYKNILRPRMIEEKMLVLLRQGRISKWFSGIGQEAIAVGITKALDKDEFIFPMHRNLGVWTSREMPLARLFAQWQGKDSGYSKGRERSFHFGAKEHHIVGMISHLGPQLALGGGVALKHLLSESGKVAVAFSGEGGTSEGDFHEALNVASVWDLPVIFVVENNGYGLSTPTDEQYRCEHIVDRAMGYGIEGHQVDGNNILDVYNLISKLKKDLAKNPRPILIEALTFRMRGHEEASGTKYVPQELFDLWGVKDPLSNFENWLLSEKMIDEAFIENLRAEFKTEIEDNLKIAFDEAPIVPNTERELNDIYAPYEQVIVDPATDKKNGKALSRCHF